MLNTFELAVAVAGKLCYFACGADKTSIDAVTPDNIEIIFIIRRRRSHLRKFRNVRNSADLFEIAVAFEPVAQRNDIDGLSLGKDHFHSA